MWNKNQDQPIHQRQFGIDQKTRSTFSPCHIQKSRRGKEGDEEKGDLHLAGHQAKTWQGTMSLIMGSIPHVTVNRHWENNKRYQEAQTNAEKKIRRMQATREP